MRGAKLSILVVCGDSICKPVIPSTFKTATSICMKVKLFNNFNDLFARFFWNMLDLPDLPILSEGSLENIFYSVIKKSSFWEYSSTAALQSSRQVNNKNNGKKTRYYVERRLPLALT